MTIANGDLGIMVLAEDGRGVMVPLEEIDNGDLGVLVQAEDGRMVALKVVEIENGDQGFLAVAEDGRQVAVKGEVEETECNYSKSMYVTVTGAGTETVFWGSGFNEFGVWENPLRWDLPGDSGVQKEMCDNKVGRINWTSYTYSTYHFEPITVSPFYTTVYGTATVYKNGDTWSNNQSPFNPQPNDDRLRLKRYYRAVNKWSNYIPTPGKAWNMQAFNQLRVQDTNKQTINWAAYGQAGPRPITPTSTYTNTSGGMSNITAVAPTIYDVGLTDDFFGSHVAGSVTYSWEKGLGW